MTTETPLNIDAAVAALAHSLEAMAFVSVVPFEDAPPPPGPDAVVVRLAFAGPARGELSIVAPRSFGLLLLGNVDPAQAEAGCTDAQAADAIGEVVNVVCGRLLREVGGGRFSLGLPRAAPLSTDDGWGELTTPTGESIVVDAEGIPVGLSLSLGL